MSDADDIKNAKIGAADLLAALSAPQWWTVPGAQPPESTGIEAPSRKPRAPTPPLVEQSAVRRTSPDKLIAMKIAYAEASLFWDHGEWRGSPIEEMMLMALRFTPPEFDDVPADYLFGMFTPEPGTVAGQRALGHEPMSRIGCSIDDWVLYSQEPAGRYVLDFAVVHHVHGRIAIECDGHEFHSVSKKQAEHDRKRDRKIQELGYRVLRFTGSEIYRDAHACVAEVVSAMESMAAKSKPEQTG